MLPEKPLSEKLFTANPTTSSPIFAGYTSKESPLSVATLYDSLTGLLSKDGTTSFIASSSFKASASAIGSFVISFTLANNPAARKHINSSDNNIFLYDDFNLAMFDYLPKSFRFHIIIN